MLLEGTTVDKGAGNWGFISLGFMKSWKSGLRANETSRILLGKFPVILRSLGSLKSDLT